MSDYLNDDKELIKDAYYSKNISPSDNLVNDTLDACNRENAKKKQSVNNGIFYLKFNKVKYLKKIAIAACFIVVFSTISIHVLNSVGGQFGKGTGSTDSFQDTLNPYSTPDKVLDVTYVEQPKVGYVLRNNDKLADTKYSISELKELADYVVQCNVKSFTSYFEKVNGLYKPYTIYTMQVVENISGDLVEGQEFEIKRSGGYFTNDIIKDIYGVEKTGSDEVVEILSFNNYLNFNIGGNYIIFMNKVEDMGLKLINSKVFVVNGDVVIPFGSENDDDVQMNDKTYLVEEFFK